MILHHQMVSSEKKLANAMGGKTTRACDSCIAKRARWHCAADDVFLCQFCDALVHSANPLARGHERARLNMASVKLSSLEMPAPTWHHGFTKKPRTPRGKNSNKHGSHRIIPSSKESRVSYNPLHLVPEIESDDLNTMNSGVLCFFGDLNEMLVPIKQAASDTNYDEFNLNSLNGLILPSDLELAEFAADVESLLGKSFDEESFRIEEAIGMAPDCRLNDWERVKVEEDQVQVGAAESEIEMMREPFQLSFDYDSPEEDEKVAMEDGKNRMGLVKKEDEKCVVVHTDNIDHDISKKTRKMLKLDYEGIIAAWDDDRSPWATGDRPELDSNDCWPECMGGCGKMQHCHCGDRGMMMGKSTRLDGGREARVSRYREKRRTRLFSKKIRYEVRKLNAEKRPRMKGRFVKRASFAATASGFPSLTT